MCAKTTSGRHRFVANYDAGVPGIVMSAVACVFVSVCLRTYLQNNMNYEFMNYTLYELFYACHLWPWLGSPSPLAALRYVQHFRL